MTMAESAHLREGFYYNQHNNQSLHWETKFLGFKGKLSKVCYGCAWLCFGTNQKLLGTPIRHDDFQSLILSKGWEYIGPVREIYKEGE